MSRIDLDSNYSMQDIEVDSRFVVAAREMYISYGFQILFMAVIIAIAYIFGGKPLEEYKFILGMPSWWFATIAATLGFLLLLIVMSNRIFKDISIEAYETDDEICDEGGEAS